MFKITAELDIDDLVLDLCNQLSPDELIDFIKMIDKETCNLDFTNELKEYFEEEMRKEEELLNE